jgi:hypothetical protein
MGWSTPHTQPNKTINSAYTYYSLTVKIFVLRKYETEIDKFFIFYWHNIAYLEREEKLQKPLNVSLGIPSSLAMPPVHQ